MLCFLGGHLLEELFVAVLQKLAAGSAQNLCRPSVPFDQLLEPFQIAVVQRDHALGMGLG